LDTPDGTLVHRAYPRASSGKCPPLLILLHGHGSDESEWDDIVHTLDQRFQMVSVRAPIEHRPGWAWYPVVVLRDGTAIPDESHAAESRERLVQTIAHCTDRYGTDPERTFLLGFSQGATLALYTAATVPGIAAGAVVLSGRLVGGIEFETTSAIDGLPVFVAHGLHDSAEPVEQGRAVRKFLEIHRATPTYREFQMGHQVDQAVWEQVLEWLSDRLDESAWSQMD